jgi:hypothetical protein
MQCHIPEEQNPQLHGNKNIKTYVQAFRIYTNTHTILSQSKPIRQGTTTANFAFVRWTPESKGKFVPVRFEVITEAMRIPVVRDMILSLGM